MTLDGFIRVMDEGRNVTVKEGVTLKWFEEDAEGPKLNLDRIPSGRGKCTGSIRLNVY